MDTPKLPDLPITPISNEALPTVSFPERRDPFDVIVDFGFTFNGYEHYGMETCAELCNKALSAYYHHDELPDDLNLLRACVFFEARRWSLHQQEPDTKGLLYIHALIDKIKQTLGIPK